MNLDINQAIQEDQEHQQVQVLPYIPGRGGCYFKQFSSSNFQFTNLKINKSSCRKIYVYLIHGKISLVFLFVCLYVCPIINHEPHDRFSLNFNWGNTGKLRKGLVLSGSTCIEKNCNIQPSAGKRRE